MLAGRYAPPVAPLVLMPDNHATQALASPAGGESRQLYTKGHVPADRWYKLWRTILYGSLEDEHPFQTVRRLAEY